MNETCEWKEDEDGVYETSCGDHRMYEISVGTPKENDMAFCPFCGRELVEIAAGAK